MSCTACRNEAHLDAFKAQWPCHGLPADLVRLEFEFSRNGDLIDMAAWNWFGELMDTEPFDGPALLALCEDALHDELVARFGGEPLADG